MNTKHPDSTDNKASAPKDAAPAPSRTKASLAAEWQQEYGDHKECSVCGCQCRDVFMGDDKAAPYASGSERRKGERRKYAEIYDGSEGIWQLSESDFWHPDLRKSDRRHPSQGERERVIEERLQDILREVDTPHCPPRFQRNVRELVEDYRILALAAQGKDGGKENG